MRLALIQNHCSPDRDENLERALNSRKQARESSADMVVFPELAIDRFFPQPEEWNARDIAEPIPGPSTNAIAAKAKALSLVTVFNLYEEAVAGRYFDSSPVFDADGMLLGVTRMVHIADYACFHEKAYYNTGDNGCDSCSEPGDSEALATSNPRFHEAPNPSLQSRVSVCMLV